MARALECKKCGRVVENIGDTAHTVTCSYCVLEVVGMPEEPKPAYTPTGRPAGWHWMAEFVDKDGNVFHKGKEVPKLKGTLKPTKVVKKKVKRRTKAELESVKIKKYQTKKKAVKKKLKSAIKKQEDFLNHRYSNE